MEPITFTPLYMTRVWGGRTLAEKYRRPLPDEQPYGESWEISDREDEMSVVSEGPLKGRTLHELWTTQREELFGKGFAEERFPLLFKILDARDDLSLQVHPPAFLAGELKGEPKTEVWYIADCEQDAKLYAGLRTGVTREDFEASLRDGTVADQVHVLKPKAGDSIFIPSGRLHAIGAGFLIFEIQQNSDTTYRVFDWNRKGLDGRPRELHVEESLKSISFDDIEPSLDPQVDDILVSCPYFKLERLTLAAESTVGNPGEQFSVLTVISGRLLSRGGRTFAAGDFLLLPKGGDDLKAEADTVVLRTTVPNHSRH